MGREMRPVSEIPCGLGKDWFMDRKSAAGTLRRIGLLLELAGENPYRVRAFSGAARAVEAVDGDLEALIASGEILQSKGIGKGTASVLSELAAGHRPTALVEAEKVVPPGVREMMTLPGLGPKKVRTLWRDLGAESLGELEYACRENRLVDLKGFGAASQSSVLEALAFRARARERRLVNQAWAESDAVIERLDSITGVTRVEVAGELRRCAETVGELGFIVDVEGAVEEASVARVLGEAERVDHGQWLIRPGEGLVVKLWFVPPLGTGAARIGATGSEAFLAELEARAAAADGRSDLWLDGDEEAVFAGLGLSWIPPELREDGSWVARAASDDLPELVEAADLHGVLHNHTTDSDGTASLEEMAAAAAHRGWSFFGVADHSPAAFYANGVDTARLQNQWGRIDAWNAVNPGLRIVKGLEADILPDGRLDIPQDCEAGLEYVVASVHSSFSMSEEEQTGRIVEAVGHPACRVLGHPTGRLLLARPGYAVDLDRVLDACAEHGVAVEINASPYRLDLDRSWAEKALDRGLKLAVNPDAHAVEGLDDVRWGLAIARRAGATKEDLVNCMDIDEFLQR